MKALTLTQPWATLVAIGAKRIETRSWATKYRGPLAIHAGKGLGPVGGVRGLIEQCNHDYFFDALFDAGQAVAVADRLPRGAIVATCELMDCRPIFTRLPEAWGYIRTDLGINQEWHLTDQERAFGDYSDGRFAWLLSNVKMLDAPILAKGALSLWEAHI